MKRIILGVFFVLFVFMLFSFVFASHVITPGSFSVNQTIISSYNITLNNTNLTNVANITMVNITIPSTFIFNGTNATDASWANLSNITLSLIWENDTIGFYVINGTNSSLNGTDSKKFFQFFAYASSIPGDYNITIITTDINGYYTQNISVQVNDTISPVAAQGENPIDNYNDADGSVTFDMKCYDNVAVSMIQLWTNTTGTWHANYTNDSMGDFNNTWLNITVEGIPEAQNYRWAVWCNDTSGLTSITENKTLGVGVPTVTLDYPAVYANLSATNISLNCSATDNFNLSNITLFVWFSNNTLFLYNNTNVSGTSNYTNVSGTMITNNSYNWTCKACDNSSNCVTASNRSIMSVDIIAPAIELTSPDLDDVLTTLKPTFEFSVTDYFNISNCSLYITGTTNQVRNISNVDSGANSITLITSLSDGGSYDWYVRCGDYAGNHRNSEQLSFTVDTGGDDDGSGGGGGSSGDDDTIIDTTSAASNAKLAGNVSQSDKTMTGLVKGNQVNFSLGNASHTLIIYNVTSNYTTIQIRSTLITAMINAGETKSFDLDGNGMNDFAITVQGISVLKKINLILKSVKETPLNMAGNLTATGSLNNTQAQISFGFLNNIQWDSIGNFFKKYWIYILIFLVVAAAVILGIIFREKIFKSGKYWWKKGGKVRLK